MSSTGIERVFDKDLLLAVIVYANFVDNKLNFLTPEDAILQLGYMNHPEGHVIPRHIHNKVRREIYGTQEALFIKSGKVAITLFSLQQEPVSHHSLSAGDAIIFLEGGHEVTIVNDAEILEVKNGPYAGAGDKIRF